MFSDWNFIPDYWGNQILVHFKRTERIQSESSTKALILLFLENSSEFVFSTDIPVNIYSNIFSRNVCTLTLRTSIDVFFNVLLHFLCWSLSKSCDLKLPAHSRTVPEEKEAVVFPDGWQSQQQQLYSVFYYTSSMFETNVRLRATPHPREAALHLLPVNLSLLTSSLCRHLLMFTAAAGSVNAPPPNAAPHLPHVDVSLQRAHELWGVVYCHLLFMWRKGSELHGNRSS